MIPRGPQDGTPWGRGATLALGAGALFAGQAAALMALTWWYHIGLDEMPDLSGDGVAIIVVMLVATPVQLTLLAFMARQTGATAVDYLALIVPRRADVVLGVLAILLFIVIGDAVSWIAGKTLVTAFQYDIYRTARAAGALPLLWLAVVVVTPINEEALFRGFLFRGWLRKPGDTWPVIVATALLWAIIHVQYDYFVIAQVFVCGLILGWFRWATGSTLLTMLLHALVNAEGMLETAFIAHG
ncbi:MAG: CPBP family intramembrane metalloprotease [Pseudolabrys sp.]|nr:CPBP family intramembrane metalloprotease [Pseudolabrys sp.]